MSDQTQPLRVHVVVGAPWKDAAISYLEPRSPYRPWPVASDVRGGDHVVVVFDCEPRLVLTDVACIDSGSIEPAIADMRYRGHGNEAVPVSLIGAGVDAASRNYALFEGAASAQLLDALEAHRLDADPLDAFGHSSMAAARVLLDSDGRCGGCGAALDLRGTNARDTVAIRTVDSPTRPANLGSALSQSDTGRHVEKRLREHRQMLHTATDWPAALCPSCRDAIRDGGFETLIDYAFSRHPPCPRCGARRTQEGLFGMLVYGTIVAPWQDERGCCVSEDIWTCTQCDHQWGAGPH